MLPFPSTLCVRMSIALLFLCRGRAAIPCGWHGGDWRGGAASPRAYHDQTPCQTYNGLEEKEIEGINTDCSLLTS